MLYHKFRKLRELCYKHKRTKVAKELEKVQEEINRLTGCLGFTYPSQILGRLVALHMHRYDLEFELKWINERI